MQYEEVESRLEEASQLIKHYGDITQLVTEIYEMIKLELKSSHFVNFRDALLHYRQMYISAKANEYLLVIEQHAGIIEHLNRGIADVIVNLIDFLCVKLQDLLHKSDDPYYRSTLHKLKNISLDIRAGGANIIRIIDQTDHLIAQLLDILQEMRGRGIISYLIRGEYS